MVLQNIKLYRLQRLNTFQRLNALSIQDPIPEHKERCCIYHSGNIRCEGESEDSAGAASDSGISSASSLASSRKSSASSFCSSRKSSASSISLSRKSSSSSIGSSRKSSASSFCSSRRSSYSSVGGPPSPDDLAAAMSASEVALQHNNNALNNNNEAAATLANKPDPSADDLKLLAALEEANRLIETDSKSLNSLGSGQGAGHSRKSSDTSQISVASGGSSGSSGAGSTGGSQLQDPEEDLWGLWGRLVNDWETWNKRKSTQLKELVRKGIPHHFRGITWQLLCSAHNSPEKANYAEYLRTTSACEKVIRRDMARTYPEHDFFKEKDGLGQESLFNVMKAYSLHDREVGYCQGSAFIVGLLLMQMPEEEAFAVLVKLMQDYRMREMFKPSMAELGLCMYQLECLIQEHLPDLHAHFTSQSFHTSMYASSWFLTLFSTTLQQPLACRMMDCFLVDGVEVIFRIALACLTLGKEELFSMDMEGMLKYFQRDLPAKFEADPECYFSLAYSLRYNPKKMKKLEKEYTAMKTKEQEELVELKRMRTENRLLRQRIDCLEAESSALADRLIRGQVSRAEEAEHNFAIKRELAALRQHDGETMEQLLTARDKIRKLTGMIEENCSSRESSLAELMVKEEELVQKEELVKCLQEELVQVRLKTAEAEATIRDLRARIQELEEEQKKMREATPDHSVAHLQEELIAVRLREAEANLALKDLRHRVQELTQLWTKHVQDQHGEKSEAAKPDVTSTPSKKLGLFWDRSSEAAKLEEELMTTKLHETAAVAELKEARLKVMELETAVQVSTNQMKRQEEENKRLQEALDAAEANIRTMQSQLGDHKRKYTDLESQMKEEKMLARIREAEKSQSLAELTQKISSLEFKNQELVTEGEVSRVGGSESDQVPRLQDKVAELQAEIARLSAINRRLTRTVSLQRLDAISGPESDADDADDYRLYLDDGELKEGGAAAVVAAAALAAAEERERKASSSSELSITAKERKVSTSSERSITPPNRESITRKTSHTLAEAFLEQLPEVKTSPEEAPVTALQNGSAPHLEMEAC
ncbi:ecotropic viral integration site 5 ortholog-like isoform X4 [Portunus trituberculatus]|uniref:ecotropic viral integration site 5 ortholog-like isoform X4 n=1 Tax=Portunus trituberculatus TaxID=210409 RepID=UPI001E1D020A|nr:ecotropic viral integration site 5 ortholog-like isoform X4 [Portunus trituberculatus]